MFSERTVSYSQGERVEFLDESQHMRLAMILNAFVKTCRFFGW